MKLKRLASPAENNDLAVCLELIERKLGWGNSADWATQDFEKLNDLISRETGVSLSITTLKRIWGKVRYESAPTLSTLNALACFLKYESWHAFRQRTKQTVAEPDVSQNEGPSPDIQSRKPGVARDRRWIIWGSAFAVLLGAALFSSQFRTVDPAPDNFRFSSRPVTDGIPNSVVFTYDAKAALTDSVYIQQSWDSTRRALLDKNGTSHTAIYYEPGYYQAKLVVGNKVVKEHPLIIPTEGWLGTIATEPVPVYLKQTEYLRSNELNLTVDTILSYGIKMHPQAPIVKYFSVGNFEATDLADFSFSSQIKNTYGEGSSACQFSWIVLLTDGMPIVIPLSQKGCVSELSLLDGENVVSGKRNDLSSFGAAVADWVKVDCKSNANKLDYYVNDKLAYSSPMPLQKLKIIGIIYAFRGAGAVKEVQLANSKGLVFKGLHKEH